MAFNVMAFLTKRPIRCNGIRRNNIRRSVRFPIIQYPCVCYSKALIMIIPFLTIYVSLLYHFNLIYSVICYIDFGVNV